YGFDQVSSELIIGKNYTFDFMVYPEANLTVKPSKRVYGPHLSDTQANMASAPDFDRDWRNDMTSPDAFVSLMQDEKVLIILTKIIDGVPSDKYIKFTELDYPNTSTELELTPGYYSVELISTLSLGENYSRPNIYMPERTYEDVGAIMGVGGEDITIDEVLINGSMYLGGITLDDTKLPYVYLSAEDIASDKELFIFYPAINPDRLKFVQDFDGLDKVQKAGEDYPDLFKAMVVEK
ncbi:hypothetical protein COV13_00910, partial [Candidatus Woesearchaeota archaeon CG10_big_fil_rev_8_21_14_0_10_32_9]